MIKRKNNRICLLIALLVASLCLESRAQVKFEFNDQGQMVTPPPGLVTDKNQLVFVVHVSEKSYNDRLLLFYKQYRNAIRHLDEIETQKQFYGLTDDAATVDPLINLVKSDLAAQLLILLRDARWAPVLQTQMDVTGEINSLTGYAGGSGLHIPAIMDLINPAYALRILPATVQSFKSPPTYLNLQPFTAPAAVPAAGSDWTYTLTIAAAELASAPANYSFQLVQQNNIYAALIAQLAANSPTDRNYVLTRFSKPQVEVLKAKIDKAIGAAFTTSGIAGNDDLLTWLTKKEAGGTITDDEETDAQAVIANVADLGTIEGKLTADVLPLINDLKNASSYKWLLQFAWFVDPEALTANPLSSSNPNQSQLKVLNKSLADAKLKQTMEAQKVKMIENRFTVAGTGNDATQTLLATYQTELDSKKTADDQVTDIQSKVDELKKTSSDFDLSAANLQHSILADSLLYDGSFMINHHNGLPNRANYAFMRHHDAQADFHLMGADIEKQINEKQRMYIQVENVNKPVSYTLKTTITPVDLKNDLDLPSAEVSNFAAATGSVEDLYKLFVELKRVLNPYQNGVLTTPLMPVQDKTPSFATRIASHEVPPTAPSLVQYEIMDTASNKNANSEATKYQYRLNKLYRFRLKAGMAYSWLERRTYTIDPSTNTATYTSDRGGLGATIGVQIFPTRLDIQKPGLFPAGPLPFFYVGYQITDAPANNFLLGGGYEIVSGVAITTGIHFGKADHLTLNNSGMLQTVSYYDHAWFLGINIGLEAFDALFNKAKPTNPSKP